MASVLKLLKGKKVNVTTNALVTVQLIIDTVEEKTNSREIGPSNADNDWYPEMSYWTTFEVTFTNGYKKTYDNISKIDIVE